MNETINNYLSELLPASPDWAKTLEAYAKENKIPIMEPLGIQFLTQLIRLHKPKCILEVGAAIGYSALKMQEASPLSQIVTMERDEERYEEAVKNISSNNKTDSIEVLFGDALDLMEDFVQQGKQFDCVFIDAAKGQYGKFFEFADQLVSSGGLIVTDNVLFRGYVAGIDEIPKKYKNMIRKLRDYNEMLSAHPSYNTTIMPVGDGVAISLKVF